MFRYSKTTEFFVRYSEAILTGECLEKRLVHQGFRYSYCGKYHNYIGLSLSFADMCYYG